MHPFACLKLGRLRTASVLWSLALTGGLRCRCFILTEFNAGKEVPCWTSASTVCCSGLCGFMFQTRDHLLLYRRADQLEYTAIQIQIALLSSIMLPHLNKATSILSSLSEFRRSLCVANCKDQMTQRSLPFINQKVK